MSPDSGYVRRIHYRQTLSYPAGRVAHNSHNNLFPAHLHLLQNTLHLFSRYHKPRMTFLYWFHVFRIHLLMLSLLWHHQKTMILQLPAHFLAGRPVYNFHSTSYCPYRDYPPSWQTFHSPQLPNMSVVNFWQYRLSLVLLNLQINHFVYMRSTKFRQSLSEKSE